MLKQYDNLTAPVQVSVWCKVALLNQTKNQAISNNVVFLLPSWALKELPKQYQNIVEDGMTELLGFCTKDLSNEFIPWEKIEGQKQAPSTPVELTVKNEYS